MNVDKFFEKHSIEEISKKTKISPISLRFIQNKEFEKIPKAKFFGFINIIEKNFNVDLSELKEEYNQFAPKKEIEQNTQPIENKKDSSKFLIIASTILTLIGGYLLFNSFSNKTQTNFSKEHNQTTINTIKQPTKTFQEITKQPEKITILKNTQPKTNQKKPIIKTPIKSSVEIIPHKQVWFRALNIDTNKTIEYLTSNKKILPKGNYYIKFGHGNITINYSNQTIEPNTKKIIRILFKNGKYKFLKKPNRYEK